MRRPSLIVFLAMLFHVLHAQAQSTSPSNVYVFPLFVDGAAGGFSYRSTLRIVKTSATNPMQCTLTQRNTSAPFIGVDGTVYSADVLDAGYSPPAVTPITLDQFLPWEILRTNAQSSLKTGYARLACLGTVEAELHLSESDGQNNKLSESTMTPARQGTSFQFLFDRRDGTRLGFAFANDSAAAGQFAIIARDRFNYEVDRAYETIEPWSQVSRFVDQMLALPADFAGSIELIGLSAGQNYAVGLQFTGTVFTTILPVVRAAPLPN